MRVLVVEDDVVIRGMVERVLARDGHEVLVAGDAQEALRMVDDGAPPPDVLLSDVVMPGMDGIELARRLCARFPRLRVVLVSGHADATHLCRRNPRWMFVRKPFDLKGLLRAVRPVATDPG